MIRKLFLIGVILAVVVSVARATDIDYDHLIGYRWNAPSNVYSVDHYDFAWWASGFAPQSDTIAMADADTFLVLDISQILPYVSQIDSVKVRGVNAHGEAGPWSNAAEPVEIHVIPEKPGTPRWVPDNN